MNNFLEKNKSKWQGLSSLKNKNITVLSSLVDNAKERLAIQSNQVNEVSTPAQAFKMLTYGRADYILMTETEGEYLLNDMDSQQNKLMSQPIGFIEIYAAFTDKIKGKQLKEIWDKHFLSYLKSKQAESLFENWGLSKNYQITLEYLTKENP